MVDKEYINCNLCDKDETGLCFEVKEKITGKEKFNVVRCKNCGLIYVNPRPKKDAILRYYPEDTYWAYQHNENKSLKAKVKEIIMEEEGNYPQRKRRTFLLRWLRRTCCLVLKNNVMIIIPYKEKGKILDVGCGSGQLIEWLKRHGWEVYGVDISSKAAKEANKRGLNVFHGELIDVKFPKNFFDTVIASQVLEHVMNPMKLLREINRILKQDALLIVGVPNIEAYESKVFGEHWGPLDIPRHLYHLSYKTLKTMLQNAGFVVEKMAGKTFFILYSNRASLDSLKQGRNKWKLLVCFLKVYFWKYIRYIFSNRKDLFGEFIAVYARKR